MDRNDEILRAYSLIDSLKENIPDKSQVNERWIREYHTAVEKLERAIGKDLSDFKVSNENLERSLASSNYLTGEKRYRDGLWCERSVLIQKVDAILTYFTGLLASGERKIGFGA